MGYGGTLFVGPNQYQYFDLTEGAYYPAASLRAFSRDILKYRRHRLPAPIVLIQDFGNGANFAHFAFDWLTRIMHSLETGIINPRSCTFIMGGPVGPFQKATVSTVMRMYGLTCDNFYFPPERVLIEVDGPFIFFSDQKLQPMHPAQMAHPRSMELLRKLKMSMSLNTDSNTSRLFVSRADAKLRRIENEGELIGIAERYGFTIVCLSTLSMTDQFTLVGQVRQIAGAHGMGFTHVFLNNGPLSILELFNPTQGTDAYALVSRALGFEYGFQVGEDLNDNRGSYRIDPAAFARGLEAMSS
jgi:capsular polysaccharide biosynthesis protein